MVQQGAFASSVAILGALWGITVVGSGGCRAERAPAPEVVIEGFEMISRGAEPRHALRYQLVAGTKSRTVLRISATPVGPAAPVPTVRFTTETEILATIDPESTPVQVTVVDAQAESQSEQALAARSIDHAIAQLTGTELHAVTSRTGKLRAIILQASGPGSEAQLQSLSNTMQQLAPELPTAEVGIGAQWAIERPFEQSGLKIKSRTIYELIERSDSALRLRSKIYLAAPDQTISAGGMSADLSAFSGNGESELTIDLTTLTARGASSSSYQGKISSAGQALDIGMTLSVQMSQP